MLRGAQRLRKAQARALLTKLYISHVGIHILVGVPQIKEGKKSLINNL